MEESKDIIRKHSTNLNQNNFKCVDDVIPSSRKKNKRNKWRRKGQGSYGPKLKFHDDPVAFEQLLAKRLKYRDNVKHGGYKTSKDNKLALKKTKVQSEEMRQKEHRKFGLKFDFLRHPVKMCDSACKLRICFDLSLSDNMTSEEFKKTMEQLLLIYSMNHKSEAPLQMNITGFSNDTRKAIRRSYFLWDVHYNHRYHTDVFERKDIVYITKDSQNVVHCLDHEKCYVISAVLDLSGRKNLNSYEVAVHDGVDHVRFPLDNYLKNGRELNFRETYCFLLRLTEGKTFAEAAEEILAFED